MMVVLVIILVHLYFVCNARRQNIILLALSAIFVWNILPLESYIILPVLLLMYTASRIAGRKRLLGLVLCVVLAIILFVLRENTLTIRSVLSFAFLNSVALLHFGTKTGSRPRFTEGSLYLLYFPKVICGPYERPESFFAALARKRSFSFPATVKGLFLILLGIFERYAMAGNISLIREGLLSSSRISVADLFMSGVLFGFELFFIISAFTNWAKGSSLIFGIPISGNFRFPYLSTSISDFWRRWHTSVHVWMKEHVYMPLAGYTDSLVTCIVVTFLFSAIWHKPASGFMVWGLLAGILTVVERKIRFVRYFGWLTVLVLISLLWVFFEIEDVSVLFSHSVHLRSNFPEALCGLMLAAFIAFAATLVCEYQARLIEKHRCSCTWPLSVVNFMLLLLLWPNATSANSVYGF